MGYSYSSRTGNLSCDFCHSAKGDTRKVRCPFGWCGAPAVCPRCKVTEAHRFTKEAHRKYNCDKNMAESQGKYAERAYLIENGRFLRCSALGMDDGRVHVLFQGNDSVVGRYMAAGTYDSIPLLVNATIEDYEKHGTVEKAPSAFSYGASKQLWSDATDKE